MLRQNDFFGRELFLQQTCQILGILFAVSMGDADGLMRRILSQGKIFLSQGLYGLLSSSDLFKSDNLAVLISF